MKTRIIAIGVIASVAVFFGIQTILPFPYGLVVGLVIAGIIAWKSIKSAGADRYSLTNYRREDPKTTQEQLQNKEAFRIVKKKFLEGEITKEEYETQKKAFGIEE